VKVDNQAQIRRTQCFRALHDRRQVFLLPNAWDAGSARAFASLGFEAIATTSAGVAWSLGYPDGEQVPWDEVIASIRRMVGVVSVPLSADIEGGYGDSPEAVAARVRSVIDAGVAGINLEDGVRHQRMRDMDDAARRIAAARQAACDAGVPIVINARVDTWIVGGGSATSERIDDTIRRAHAYLAAGADCIFPIGVADPGVIATLCAAIKAPVNIGVRAGLPNLAELGRLGVARVSTATRLAIIALAGARAAAEKLRRTGSFDDLDATLDYERIQQLFVSPDNTEGEPS
jgi:2-methylisocitrate lyase-like PEP mutase family enzyme